MKRNSEPSTSEEVSRAARGLRSSALGRAVGHALAASAVGRVHLVRITVLAPPETAEGPSGFSVRGGVTALIAVATGWIGAAPVSVRARRVEGAEQADLLEVTVSYANGANAVCQYGMLDAVGSTTVHDVLVAGSTGLLSRSWGREPLTVMTPLGTTPVPASLAAADEALLPSTVAAALDRAVARSLAESALVSVCPEQVA